MGDQYDQLAGTFVTNGRYPSYLLQARLSVKSSYADAQETELEGRIQISGYRLLAAHMLCCMKILGRQFLNLRILYLA